MIVRVIASRTASAPMSGKCGCVLHPSFVVMSSHARQVYQHDETCRVLYQVPIAELPRRKMRSPSQWPGTARSAAFAGR